MDDMSDLQIMSDAEVNRTRVAIESARAKFPKTRYLPEVAPYWQIEWLVPAQNAIGGVAYWSPLVLRQEPERHLVHDEATARSLFETAKTTFKDQLRLIRVDTTVLESFTPNPAPEHA